MGYSNRDYARGYLSASNFPKGVRWLLITNTVIFVIYAIAASVGYAELFAPFGLVPAVVVKRFAVWQLFTYMFLHDPYGFLHILFNMLTLWMFGKDLEMLWGTRRFLNYYFICGVGAGICVVIGNYLFGNIDTRTIGASGAIYGLLLAFGMMFPDAIVMFFVWPMRAKYFVAIYGAMAFLGSIIARNSGVSNIAHLGGMAFGYMYFKRELQKSRTRRKAGLGSTGVSSTGLSFFDSLLQQYKTWKLERNKRKFQVYMRKHGGGPDSPIN